MNLLPGTRAKIINWFLSRLEAWEVDPAAIGLSVAQVQALRARVELAQDAELAARRARAASVAATRAFYVAADAAIGPGRAAIATIKAFAAASDEPEVLALARIGPRAAGSPVPPPMMPENLSGVIGATGQLTLRWSARTSGPRSGIFFLVERRLPAGVGGSMFVTVGATPALEFTDPAPGLAAGAVAYRVRAVRGAAMSDWTVPVEFDVTIAAGPGEIRPSAAASRPSAAANHPIAAASSSGGAEKRGRAAAA